MLVHFLFFSYRKLLSLSSAYFFIFSISYRVQCIQCTVHIQCIKFSSFCFFQDDDEITSFTLSHNDEVRFSLQCLLRVFINREKFFTTIFSNLESVQYIFIIFHTIFIFHISILICGCFRIARKAACMTFLILDWFHTIPAIFFENV